MSKQECCGTCRYNKRDWECKFNPDFYCSNEYSENYGYNTEYTTHCDEYEAKEQEHE